MTPKTKKTRKPSNAAIQAVDWFVRMQSRPLDAAEQDAFKAWLAASPEHRCEFDKLDIIWHSAPSLAEIEAHRSAPEQQPFSWIASDAWRSAVCPTIQRLAARPAVTDILSHRAAAVPAFLL